MRQLAWLVLLVAFYAEGQNSERSNTAKENPILGAARALRDKMRDPESFRVNAVFLRIVRNPKREVKGIYLCFDYRSKNGIGGYNTGHVAGIGSSTDGEFRMPSLDTYDVWEALFVAFCEDNGDPADEIVDTDVTDGVKAALKADREKE